MPKVTRKRRDPSTTKRGSSRPQPNPGEPPEETPAGDPNTMEEREYLQRTALEKVKSIQDILAQAKYDVDSIEAQIIHLRRIQTKLDEYDDYFQSTLRGQQYEDAYDAIERRNLSITTCLVKADKAVKQGSDATSTLPLSPDGRRPLRLPIQELLHFHGDPSRFDEYFNVVTTSLEGHNFTEIEKIRYLLGTLHGDARKIVGSLGLKERSYQDAKDLLINKYRAAPRIKEGLILQLLNLKEPRDNPKELFSFQADVISLVKDLQNRSQDGDCTCTLFSNVMGTIMFNKLPKRIQDLSCQHDLDKSWTLELLDETLNKVLATMQATGTIEQSRRRLAEEKETLRVRSRFNTFRAPRPQIQTSTVLHTATQRPKPTPRYHPYNKQDQRSVEIPEPTTSTALPRFNPPSCEPSVKTKPTCRYCQGPHFAARCITYLNVKDRIQIVRAHRWCYNCLGDGHSHPNCTNKGRCHTCNGPHHTSLCYNPAGSPPIEPRGPSLMFALNQPGTSRENQSWITRRAPAPMLPPPTNRKKTHL